MKALDMTALALVIIGGLNWLLVGLFEFDLVASIFGSQENIGAKIVYILVGLAALYSLKFFSHINNHYAVGQDTNRVTGTGTAATDTTGTTPMGATGTAAGTETDDTDPTAGSTKNRTVDADTRTGVDSRDAENDPDENDKK